MKIQQKCEWLFVFYIQEIKSFRPFLKRLFTTINQVGCKPSYSIWVVLHKLVQDENNRGHFELDVQTFDMDNIPSGLTSVPLTQMNTTATAADAWVTAFQYILNKVTHSRKAIFTWSHGCGFGINVADYEQATSFRTESALRPDEYGRKDGIVNVGANHTLINAFQYEKISNSRFRYLFDNKVQESGNSNKKLAPNELYIIEKKASNNCEKLELLWMSDFAKVLTDLSRVRPFDLMIMINCFMQLFENGYMLREAVDILIGPETSMWAYGYDYEKIFGYIEETPSISSEDLAKKIVHDYIQMHRAMGHNKYLDGTMLFANKLKTYELINCELENTSSELISRITDVKPSIDALRALPYFRTVSEVTGLFLLDLELWIKTLYEKNILQSADLANLDKFLELKKATRIAEHVGADLILADQIGPGKFGDGGCSLFFPPGATITSAGQVGWCEYFSGERTSPFQQSSKWDELLKLLNR